MTEPESRVLVYLRRIDVKVDAMAQGIRELKERVSSLDDRRGVSPSGYRGLGRNRRSTSVRG